VNGGRGRNCQSESKSSDLIERFAQKHRLRIGRDDCNDAIVFGRQGDISDFGDGVRLIVSLWGHGSFSRTRAARVRKAITEKLGERISGSLGGDEATFAFDPTDERASRFFLSALRIKPKRRTTPAMLKHLSQMRARAKTKKTSPARPFQTPETAASVSGGVQQRGGGL
jgi:hypothetical protein